MRVKSRKHTAMVSTKRQGFLDRIVQLEEQQGIIECSGLVGGIFNIFDEHSHALWCVDMRSEDQGRIDRGIIAGGINGRLRTIGLRNEK